jgi:hypothetical protein
MKPGFALFWLILTPGWCQVAKPAGLAASSLPAARAGRIPLETMKELERGFNHRLVTMADVNSNEAVDLLGDARGVQLEDYGVVFTAEVGLVISPGIMPGRPTIPPEMAARVRKLKLERMPLLKVAMREMMRNMATAFTQIPGGHQLVLVVRLWYAPWEDTTGMPAQVIMRADRTSAAAGKMETEER